MSNPVNENTPLQSLDEWEDFVKERYPDPAAATEFKATDPDKKQEEFRNYEVDARPTVREFYRLNHLHQTHGFALAKRKEFLGLNRMKMSIWEAAEYLNQLVDDSDPDTDMTQLEHLLQTAEQLRRDGQPRWMILTGFVHDLGTGLGEKAISRWRMEKPTRFRKGLGRLFSYSVHCANGDWRSCVSLSIGDVVVLPRNSFADCTEFVE